MYAYFTTTRFSTTFLTFFGIIKNTGTYLNFDVYMTEIYEMKSPCLISIFLQEFHILLLCHPILQENWQCKNQSRNLQNIRNLYYSLEHVQINAMSTQTSS